MTAAENGVALAGVGQRGVGHPDLQWPVLDRAATERDGEQLGAETNSEHWFTQDSGHLDQTPLVTQVRGLIDIGSPIRCAKDDQP